jgi:cytochrome c-type biogenesis protein CcmH
VRIALLAVLLLSLLAPASASSAEPRFSQDELERELMCPTCKSPLYLSHSPAADRIRAFVAEKREEGWTKEQVKDRLVADFGSEILASPEREGLGLAAWLVPLLAVLAGLAAAVGLAIAWRRRSRASAPEQPAAGEPLPEDLDARVDDALARFD